MKLHLINEYKSKFLEYLSSLFVRNIPYTEGFKWDIIGQWKDNFSMEQSDFSEAFAQSLINEHSGRLWDGERFSIKSGMIMLIKENPLLMQIAFKDLFNESKDINMRFNRFIFHCDEALSGLHKKDDRINTHYQNEYAISLYLSLEYPERYGLFNYDSFIKFMELIESPNPPLPQEKDRYYKVLNAIYNVLLKDDDFMNGINFLLKDREYTGKSMFLINDFIEFSLKQSDTNHG